MKYHIFTNEVNQEIAINLDYCISIYKGFLCTNQPTLIFVVENINDITQIFKTKEERDEVFNKLTKE